MIKVSWSHPVFESKQGQNSSLIKLVEPWGGIVKQMASPVTAMCRLCRLHSNGFIARAEKLGGYS